MGYSISETKVSGVCPGESQKVKSFPPTGYPFLKLPSFPYLKMTLLYRLSCRYTTHSGTCLHLAKDETFRHFRLPEKESTQGESAVGGLARTRKRK